MIRWPLVLLLVGCAHPAAIPYRLTTCPAAVVVPAPLPPIRTVEMVVAHDAAEGRALAASERARAECAETLRRLVDWVEGR